MPQKESFHRKFSNLTKLPKLKKNPFSTLPHHCNFHSPHSCNCHNIRLRSPAVWQGTAKELKRHKETRPNTSEKFCSLQLLNTEYTQT